MMHGQKNVKLSEQSVRRQMRYGGLFVGRD